jgi:hypothetical protein
MDLNDLSDYQLFWEERKQESNFMGSKPLQETSATKSHGGDSSIEGTLKCASIVEMEAL